MTARALMVTHKVIARRGFPWTAFGLCVLLYLLLVAIGFNDIEEDAFIYFRFAANIAEGHGYVFNVGGERIESCSGLLWLGLMVVLYHLPLHLVLSTKLLCLCFGVGCIALMFRLSRRFVMHRWLELIPPFLMVVSIPFYVWSVRGLETAFYWFAVLWLLETITTPSRWRAIWALPALMVLNARPEGFLFVVAALPYLFLCVRKESAFWRNLFVVVVVTALVTAWRFWYFHDLLPHPFYLKVSDGQANHLRNLLSFGWYHSWCILVLLALPGLVSRWKRQDMALFSFLLMAFLWNVYVGEDKAFNRHIGVLVPFIALSTLTCCARWLPVRVWVRQASALLLAGVCVYSLVWGRYVHFSDSHRGPFAGNLFRAVTQSDQYWPEVWRLIRNPDDFSDKPTLGIFTIRYNLISSVGDFVRLNYTESTRVVYDQMGQAPWYAGQGSVFFDNLGLCYRDIGLLRFQAFSQNSLIYSGYERVVGGLLDYFWPGEKRHHSEAEVLQRLLAQSPDVLIIRKPYLLNSPDSVFVHFLQMPAVMQTYRARWLLNNRELVFERVVYQGMVPQGMAREYDQMPHVPPGATVQPITQFEWCGEQACWSVGDPLRI